MTHLGGEFIDSRALAIVKPSVVKHQLNIIDELPWVLVQVAIQLPPDGRQVHRCLDNVEVVGNMKSDRIDGFAKNWPFRLLMIELIQQRLQQCAKFFRIMNLKWRQ